MVLDSNSKSIYMQSLTHVYLMWNHLYTVPPTIYYLYTLRSNSTNSFLKHFVSDTFIYHVVSLMIMASGFGLEGPSSILDTAKDPPSACGVCARKIRRFRKSHGRSLAVYHGCCLWRQFPSFSEAYIKIVVVEMDAAAIYRRKAEIVLLLYKMDLASQE